MDAPFLINTEQSDSNIDIKVSGDLIINHIEKIKSSFDEIIDGDKNINLFLDNPSSIDITFIQLIISLIKTSKSNNTDFTFSGNFSDEINSLIANAGFKDLFNIE